ncbi:MAG: DUF192 domain-containing protein, partial [Candidatus Sungbacteria bacterium]|nr:DUF192 domain-containing protein [Candidatus Sungbacteria bacterium]
MNSVFKKYIFIVASTLFLCGSILIAYQTSFHPLTAPSGSQVTNASEIISPPPSVEIDGTTIAVELATTSAAVAKGLSGRASLEQDRGMLFIFSRPDRYRFWMPNMHF